MPVVIGALEHKPEEHRTNVNGIRGKEEHSDYPDNSAEKIR